MILPKSKEDLNLSTAKLYILWLIEQLFLQMPFCSLSNEMSPSKNLGSLSILVPTTIAVISNTPFHSIRARPQHM